MAISKFIKIGLTGGIGSGKSTVSELLKENGIVIIDADKISREVLEIYPDLNKAIKEQFGEKFFDSGKLNRRKLGNHVFKNKLLREQLENIMIPFIKSQIFKAIEKCIDRGESMCVVDAPTLIEHNLHECMDVNILVWVDRKTQIERVIKRDVLDYDEVMNRINSQMPLDEKRRFVDYIIDNTGSMDATKEQTEHIIHNIKVMGGLG